MMKITKYGHSCLLIEEDKARILIDPGVYSDGFQDLTNLGAVLVTHQHQDHLSPENLVGLAGKNPGLKVYADEGSFQKLEDQEMLDVHAVHAGEEFDVAGVKVQVVGTDHAVIHPTMQGIPNVGYLVAKRFFHPGDNFTLPGVPVDVLALPAGAPWLKISEAIDYVLAIRPEIAIPIHDAVLAIPEMNQGLIMRFAEPAGIELRVVPNGQSTEV
jgi:L-ascorbate metabolism protein UlaG (beta-lactamase superfamily)